MFFYIGDDCPIKLNQVESRLFLDDGWNQQNDIWYKGYSTDCALPDVLIDIINGYQPAGKWCVLYKEQIYHPVLRGFPLYELGGRKTNLKLDGFDIVIYPEVLPSLGTALPIDEVSERIGDILVENTRNLLVHNTVPELTAIFSAGLDTLTTWAIIDHVTKEYTLSVRLPDESHTTLLDYLGTERDYNSDLMNKAGSDYWGYYHANFYSNTNWNITGYYAETYTYRDGEAINALANYQGKRIDELASETDYLYWFLKRPNIVEKYRDSTLRFSDDEALKRFLWTTIWYDHQMWHLDNNMMFCPFADIRIPELVHRLSVSDLALCCVSGLLQRNIVNRFRPDLLPLLSDYKNAGDVWKNFRSNFNESMIDPKTKIIFR